MVYTDGSPELSKACRNLNVRFHRTSPPGKWRKNGRIERQVGLLKGGTRSAIERAGFPPPAWPWAGRHFVFARNIAQITDPNHPNFASTPYRLRFGEDFKGHVIPFGAKIDFMPTPTNQRPQDQKGIWSKKTLTGVFLWYNTQGGKWDGTYACAALEEFHKLNFTSGEGLDSISIHHVEEVEWNAEWDYDDIQFPLLDHATFSRKIQRELQLQKVYNPHQHTLTTSLRGQSTLFRLTVLVTMVNMYNISRMSSHLSLVTPLTQTVTAMTNHAMTQPP